MRQFRSFPSTLWTLIQKAGAGDVAAIDQFIEHYRPAVVAFLQRRGLDPERAEDVAQEAFLVLLEKNALARVERAGGKFRSWLIGVTKNVLGNLIKRERAQKRGGGQEAVSLDRGDGADIVEPAAPEVAAGEDDFDRLWVMNLLHRALEGLRAESGRRGTPYAEALRLVVEERCNYRAAATRLGKSENDVRNYVHRARKMLADLLRAEVAGYACNAEDYSAEIRYVETLLTQAGHVP